MTAKDILDAVDVLQGIIQPQSEQILILTREISKISTTVDNIEKIQSTHVPAINQDVKDLKEHFDGRIAVLKEQNDKIQDTLAVHSRYVTFGTWLLTKIPLAAFATALIAFVGNFYNKILAAIGSVFR